MDEWYKWATAVQLVGRRRCRPCLVVSPMHSSVSCWCWQLLMAMFIVWGMLVGANSVLHIASAAIYSAMACSQLMPCFFCTSLDGVWEG